MAEPTVRYIVDDVAAALPFYQRLGFALRLHPAPGFAALERDGLRLLLNQPGAGGAGRDTADGRTPAPGGWNRLQLPTDDLDATVSELGQAGIRFRGDIVVGNGGRQILAEDPSGNLVELFESRGDHRTGRQGRELARSTPPAEDTEGVARKFIQVWSAGNLDLIDRLAHPDLEVRYTHFPEPIKGRAAFRAVLQDTFRHFPDLVTTARAVIPGEHEAAVEWQYEGTHTHGELFGVEPSGRRVRVTGMTMYRIRDGKVVDERGVVDVLGLMTQVGALGPPS